MCQIRPLVAFQKHRMTQKKTWNDATCGFSKTWNDARREYSAFDRSLLHSCLQFQIRELRIFVSFPMHNLPVAFSILNGHTGNTLRQEMQKEMSFPNRRKFPTLFQDLTIPKKII